MLNKLKKQDKGFTIIEVMIVLAIAGLILLIVFLAVPALQRNSRNTQRKNDVADLLSGISTYITNNNGALPATAATLGSSGSTVATIGASTTNTETVNLGYYDASNVKIVAGTTTATANPNDVDKVTIVLGVDCGTGGASGTTTGGSSRSFVALYTGESGGTNPKFCQAS